MPTTTKIEKYLIYYSTSAFAPRIGLFATGKFIGQLNFKEDGATLPADELKNGVPWLWYHKHDFAALVDIMRNEKPAYLYYNGTGGGNENGIKTETPAFTLKKATAATRPRRAR
jgi:hypothetical protein